LANATAFALALAAFVWWEFLGDRRGMAKIDWMDAMEKDP